jgi:hypothetical protein
MFTGVVQREQLGDNTMKNNKNVVSNLTQQTCSHKQGVYIPPHLGDGGGYTPLPNRAGGDDQMINLKNAD